MVTLVDSAGGIVISVLFQVVFFHDFPNLAKILGTLLVLLAIFIVGVNKIWKTKKSKCLMQ